MALATSNVEICNLALTKLGEDPITALTEDSKAGRLSNLHFARLRNVVLRSHTWNFAVKRASLAQSTVAPEYRFTAKYALPDDFLRIIDCNLLNDVSWKIEGKFLVCDADTVKIRYIAQIEDPGQFDELFIEALAARIASELAIPLADNVNLSDFMEQRYQRKLREARTADATEGNPEFLEASTWLDSRVDYNSPYPFEN